VHHAGVIGTTVKQWLMDLGFGSSPKAESSKVRISANEWGKPLYFSCPRGRSLWLGAFGRTGRS